MRVLAPFFTVLAACVTIFATIVKLWWSKPKPLTKDGEVIYDDDGTPREQSPKASPWLAAFAKWWLIIVVGGGTLILIVIAVLTLIQMST